MTEARENNAGHTRAGTCCTFQSQGKWILWEKSLPWMSQRVLDKWDFFFSVFASRASWSSVCLLIIVRAELVRKSMSFFELMHPSLEIRPRPDCASSHLLRPISSTEWWTFHIPWCHRPSPRQSDGHSAFAGPTDSVTQQRDGHSACAGATDSLRQQGDGHSFHGLPLPQDRFSDRVMDIPRLWTQP